LALSDSASAQNWRWDSPPGQPTTTTRLGRSFPDLLIAATAEIEGLTVLHYDADFDLIAEITGQAWEWVVRKGTI
jgi:hypothetical protein